MPVPVGPLPSSGPRRALLTPSASPSLPPPDRPPVKRARLTSTPSAAPSSSNESTSSADVDSARRASTLRVLNVWAQLAERYNKRLDEDDIVDLYSMAIIKDRGVVKGAPKEYPIGHFAPPDGEQEDPEADQDQEDSEQDDDDNELPPSEAATDDDVPLSKILRGVPPLSATTDAEDLREFLEAEKRRRELVGDEDDDEGLSQEHLVAIRKALEEESQRELAAIENGIQDVTSAEAPLERRADATPTRPSTVPPSDDDSDDELGQWAHDESTAVYPVAGDGVEQHTPEVERDVIELTDSDSDEEFEAILTRPPRVTPLSPMPAPDRKEAPQLPQSPPDSERGEPLSRKRSLSKRKSKTDGVPNSSRGRHSSLLPKPEPISTHKRKVSVSKEAGPVPFDDGRSNQEVVNHTPATNKGKGKGKQVPSPADDSDREKTPKPLGVVPRGRKRKRIASSTNSPPLQSLEEPKSKSRSRGRPTSRLSTTPSQLDGLEPTWDQDAPTPVRFETTISGPSSPLRSLPTVSKTPQPSSIKLPCGPGKPELAQPPSHNYDTNRLPPNPPTAIAHPFSQRHLSHPPPILSSPNQGTPGPPFTGHPPPPMDPVQAQQAHFLLAQAMQQLSYLISATMPYTSYASSPGQPWHPPPPPPHPTYSTPIHPPQFHGTHAYHTPSSSISLPPSSPILPAISPPVEERHGQSRGRSKSRARRVSFELSSEKVAIDREGNMQSAFHRSGQKSRPPILEARREKEKVTEEFDHTLRLEDRESPPREVSRGRTPGPPARRRKDVSRGKSLSRR